MTNVINIVRLTRNAEKDLRKVPSHIASKLKAWVSAVEKFGLEEVKKVPGFHDELLKGDRQGQRSIRLSKAYRAIYEIRGDEIEFIEVQEVNKHAY